MHEASGGYVPQESPAASRPGVVSRTRKGPLSAPTHPAFAERVEAQADIEGAEEKPPLLSPEQLARIEDYLRTEGVIRDEYVEALNRKVKIVDLRRLADDRSLYDKAFQSRITRNGKESTISKRETLFQLLGGKEGLTPEQIEQEDFSPKPFLYIPESVKAATSMVSIKNAEFHAGIWELVGNYNPLVQHPVEFKDDRDSVSDIEIRCAALIFHPRYGDAFRQGTDLFIKDAETRKYVPFSWTALRGYGIHDRALVGPLADVNRSTSIQEGMRKTLPHLVEKDLLIPERDVRSLSLARGEEADEQKEFGKVLRNPRYVMINRVNHYLDRNGVQGEFWVERLTDTIGALRDTTTKKVVCTFSIFTREKIKPTKSGWYTAGAKESRPLPLVPESFTSPKRPHESDAHYKARVHIVDEGMQKFLALAQAQANPQLANLFRDSNPVEKHKVGDAIRFVAETDGGEESFAKLAEEFGSDEATTHKILSSYSGLIEAADEAEDFVRGNIECEAKECEEMALRVRFNILSRAQQLLTSSVRTTDPSRVAEKFNHFSKAGTLFAQAFKELRKQGDIEWEEIKNASFEQIPGKEITPEDKAAMTEIWESHYKGKYPKEYEEKIRESFRDSFSNDTVHYYLFKQGDAVVSFFSSKDLGVSEEGLRRKYLGSFMSHQSYEGGGLGQVVLEKGLAEEQKDSVLEGECDIDCVRTPIVSKYFEEYGFVGVRSYEDDGEPTLALERYGDARFETKTLSRDAIFARAGSPDSETPRVRYVKSVATPDFEKNLQEGFCLTRYFHATDPHGGAPMYYAVFERSSDVG